MTATLVREQVHPGNALVAGSQGNVQALADGSWMVGWGEVPYLSEFSAAGSLLFDAHLPATYESYRAYRLPWSGQPTDLPALAVHARKARGAIVYASWNGATQVASWRVLGGSSPGALVPVASRAKDGFETALTVASVSAGSYVQLQALDASGAVIGASHVHRV
jgi:hypothetical protein